MGTVSAFCTSFYSFRLLYLVFFASSNAHRNVIQRAHESSGMMALVLAVLSLGSGFSGFLFKDALSGAGSVF